MEKNFSIIKTARKHLRAIDHPLRQRFVMYLAETGPITVTNLYIHFRLEQSVASQHLAILRRSGFVTTKRSGKHIYYSANQDRLDIVAEYCRLVNSFK